MVNRWGIWMMMLQGLSAVFVLAPERAYSQVSFQTVSLNENAIGPRTFFSMVLANSGLACDVRFDGDIRTKKGEVVLSFRTDPIRIGLGSMSVLSADLVMRAYDHGTSDAGRSVMKFSRLPQGEYVFCVRLEAIQAESRDEYCDRIQVEDFLFLDLVDPWDGDSIDEVRPTLSWTLSGTPIAVTGADVRIVLVPMEKGMRPAHALSLNRPLFMMPHVREFSMAYPPGIPDLGRGRCYAWQAERLDGSRVIDRSDPWGFCVRKHEKPVPVKYVLLGRGQNVAAYQVVDDKIHFRYDSPYSVAHLDCSVRDKNGKRVDAEAHMDGTAGAIQLGDKGAGLFELDLQPLGLRSGQYELVVKDAKQGISKLPFIIKR